MSMLRFVLKGVLLFLFPLIYSFQLFIPHSSIPRSSARSRNEATGPQVAMIPLQYQEIQDSYARKAIEKIKIDPVVINCNGENILANTSYLHYRPERPITTTPLVLIHGFDSSCLEFRKLAPSLGEKYTVYAPDILGWGFNDCSQVRDFSPAAKLEHLKQFLLQIVTPQQPCILIGASLGGGIAINLATEVCSELVDKIVLIDAQGFIDGKGPAKNIPKFVARIGINLLKSRLIRSYANVVSYTDKSLATDDAYRIGRLHCLLPQWEEASIDFLLSGGFTFSQNIPKVQQETLVIWGEDDQILPIDNAYRFQSQLSKNRLEVIPRCGHVPHIEQPERVVELIDSFLLRKKKSE